MAKKWFPGHYTMAEPDVTPNPSIKPWARLSGPGSEKLAGVKQYIAWRRVEPTLGTFVWDPIHALLDSLDGKKAIISLATQGWNETLVPVPCPADMVGSSMYDGGYRTKSGGGGLVPNATIHMASTMDRYLAMCAAFAAEFDNDERLALVTTMEIPYDEDYKVRPPVGQYDDAVFRAQLYKLAQTFPTLFRRTPAISLGAWWAPAASGAGATADRAQYAEYLLAAGGGMGIPDCVAVGTGNYNSNFRPSLLANAGKWPCSMGMEWADLLVNSTGATSNSSGQKTYGYLPWPESHIEAGNLAKANFWWWNTGERQVGDPIQPNGDGGRGFDAHFLPYLSANPGAGITRTMPENIQSPATDMANVGNISGTARSSIGAIYGCPIANIAAI